jgi:hypothetical protein
VDESLLTVWVSTSYGIIVFWANDELLDDARKRDVGQHTVRLALPAHLFAGQQFLVTLALGIPMIVEWQVCRDCLSFRGSDPPWALEPYGIPWPAVTSARGHWRYGTRTPEPSPLREGT